MKTEITKWLNDQHTFIGEAADLLLKNGKIEENDIHKLVAIIKNIDPKVAITLKEYPQLNEASKTFDSFRLVSIGDIKGIENLAPRNPLKFGNEKVNLNVVYGNNGSGKSGYVRILKKASGKVGAKDLKQNVFKQFVGQLQCTINFEKNRKMLAIDWIANSFPIPELQDVDIFDSETGRFYIETDNAPTYVPFELQLFSDLVDVCKNINSVLETEKSALVKMLPAMPRSYTNTSSGKIYINLSHKTEISTLEKITYWSDINSKELSCINERINTIDSIVKAKKLQETKQQIDKIGASLKDAISEVDIEHCRRIIGYRIQAEESRKAALEGAKVISNTAELESIGSDTWMALWTAARNYSINEAYKDKVYPNIDDQARCVLCNQLLDSDAKERLFFFESYVRGKLQTEAEAKGKKYTDTLQTLPNVPNGEYLNTICNAADLTEAHSKSLKLSWKEVNRVIEEIRSAKAINEITCFDQSFATVLNDLSEISKATEIQSNKFVEDSSQTNRNELESEFLELQSRQWISQQAEAVKIEISRLKQVEQFEKWLKLTNSTSISTKAGKISEILITEAYITRFNNELQNLGAKNISVELIKTRVERGHIRHQVKLKNVVINATKVDDILSEGELRIVSLAAFLADVTGKKTKSPVIIDDPISSLDLGFEERTVKRLIELSKDRQVIVFTHRLSLLGMINEKSDIESIHVRRETWGNGEPGEIPIFGKSPGKALTHLKKSRVIQAKKTLNESGYDAYYPLAKALCSDIRILIERIIETDFLADVIQRYRQSVNTKGKIEQLSKINQKDCSFVDEYMAKYSCYEHSQSFETPIDVPEPEVLEKDISAILAWLDEFKTREIDPIVVELNKN